METALTDDNQSTDSTTGDSSQPSWMDQLPDDLKTNEYLAESPTIGDVSKKLIDLKGHFDKSVQLPGEDATDDQKNDFFQKLGRPENADGYEFPEVKLPDRFGQMGEQIAEDEAWFKQAAFKLGLTKGQASEFRNSYLDRLVEMDGSLTQKEKEYFDNTKADLQKLWGEKATENIELAHRAAMKGAEAAGIHGEFKEYIDSSGLGDNPMLIKVFYALGKAMSEDSVGATGKEGVDTPTGEIKRDAEGNAILNFPSMDK
jgi:hypothetical protein